MSLDASHGSLYISYGILTSFWALLWAFTDALHYKYDARDKDNVKISWQTLEPWESSSSHTETIFNWKKVLFTDEIENPLYLMESISYNPL